MKLTRRKLARAVVRLLDRDPGNSARILKTAAAYLVKNRQANQSHLLLNDIARELKAQKGHVAAQVVTAHKLSDEQRSQIANMLKQNGAKTTELIEQVDPSVIGGISVRLPGKEMDATIKTQIRSLGGR